jgi:D-glycero-alpha-D-manno-heptose-7-phosphate kinase
MIITRTPLRVSLGGGGTDLPSYYLEHGGFVLAGAINKYIYVALNKTFSNDYVLKYSKQENVATIDQIDHPIVREVFKKHGVKPSTEMVSVADIPAGTGLGSSGTFTVGLLRSVSAYQRRHATPGMLASEACQIEIEDLHRSVGKQDQYIAAFGGLTCFNFEQDGSVSITPLQISSDTLHDLEEHLLMFFTGYSRDAEDMLEDQKKRSEKNDPDMLENLHFIKKLGIQSKEALEAGKTKLFGELMHEHWEMKRSRTQGMSNPEIDSWYELGRANGAVGGKLVGAGAGGFLLFYASEPAKLRKVMKAAGLSEVRFTFDLDGSVVHTRD